MPDKLTVNGIVRSRALKDRRVLLGVIFFVFLSTSVMSISAVNNSIGIKAGDWVKYGITIAGNPTHMFPMNVSWMKVEFLNVAGTSITYRLTYHLKNGTETNQTSTFDLTSANSGPIIPANSTVGDTVYVGGSSTTITSETTRRYAGTSRTVLGVSYSQGGSNYTYYWDKQTGVAVEMSFAYSDYSISAVVTETNMWTGGFLGLDWWLWAIIILIIVVAAAIAALMLRRRRPVAKTPPPQVPPPPPPPQ